MSQASASDPWMVTATGDTVDLPATKFTNGKGFYKIIASPTPKAE